MKEQRYLLCLYLFDHQRRVLLPSSGDGWTGPIMCRPNEDEKQLSIIFNIALWRVLNNDWNVSEKGIVYLQSRPYEVLGIFGFEYEPKVRTLIHSVAISLCRDIESIDRSLPIPSSIIDNNWYDIQAPPLGVERHVLSNLRVLRYKLRGRGPGRKRHISDDQIKMF